MVFSPDSSSSRRAAPVEGSSNRTFGAVFAAFFVVVGAGPWLRGGAPRLWALALALVFAGLALAWPAALTWPNRVWTKFGLLLHRVTSPVALTAIYVVGIVPAGLLMRLFGKDPLRLKRAPDAVTYWIERAPPARADERMKHQF